MTTAPEVGTAYLQVRSRVGDLVSGLAAEQAERPVPACPQWTVRQLVAHLAGGCSDVLARRTEGAPSPRWTAAHVAARADRSVSELLAEWSADAPQLVAALAGRGLMGQALMDALSHEYDLREALDVPPPADDPVLTLALDWLAPRFGRVLDAAGVPPLRLVTEGGDLLVGSGEPAVTLRTTRLDALRMLTGRRSAEHVATADWSGDPAPWIEALSWGPFSPPASVRDRPASA